MIVTSESVGICNDDGSITNVLLSNPDIITSYLPNAISVSDCSSYALGETFTLGFNDSHLNVYDINTDAVSSSIYYPTATSNWYHTGLLSNNERWAACVNETSHLSFQLFTLDGTTIAAHQNSTLWNATCVSGGVINTEFGENIFMVEGPDERVRFAFIEDRDDNAVVYTNDQFVEINTGHELVEAKASYSGLVMVKHDNNLFTPIYTDGMTWIAAPTIDHGYDNVLDWDVSKTDGTLFIRYDQYNVVVYSRVGNEWIEQGVIPFDERPVKFDSMSLNDFYWYDVNGYLYNIQASVPTTAPTSSPTTTPTKFPTDAPTGIPTATPTNSPTDTPTNSPTGAPTRSPSLSPSKSPTTTSPSATPTTPKPTTVSPTKSPTLIENSVDGTTLGVIFGSVVGATIVGVIVYTMWANWGGPSGAEAVASSIPY